MRWNALCVTVREQSQVNRVEKELELLSQLGVFEADEVLVVEDACENVGSAGSALNALLVITERLCSKRGFSVLNESVLEECRILILLTGEPDSHDPCGCTFMPASPVTEWGCTSDTVIARTIRNINEISEGSEKGLWISGMDSIYHLDKLPQLPKNLSSPLCFYFNGDKRLSETHGAYKISEENFVTEMSYCKLEENPLVILGLLYLPPCLVTTFLTLHSVYPLSCATFYGADTGAKGLKLSLFFDLIQATCLSAKEYTDNSIGETKIDDHADIRHLARNEIWKRFHKSRSIAVQLDLSNYRYLPLEPITARLYIHVWILQLLDDFRAAAANHPKPIKDIAKAILAVSQNESGLLLDSLKECCTTPKNTSHCFSLTSDVLAMMASGNGGLRSGPAANPEFREAFKLLENAQLSEGVEAIFTVLKSNWMSSPVKIIRAAKHFEAAAQILTRTEIKRLCREHSLSLKNANQSAPYYSVTVKSAARIDIFGGWLDTPPITSMINPSAVVNMAVLIDKDYPLSCNLTKTDSHVLRLDIDGRYVTFTSSKKIWETHSNPTAEGSLICACLVALEVISGPSDNFYLALKDILGSTGLDITCKSSLPQGSGLGTSSILACCIIKAFCTLAGYEQISNKEVVHLVLCVEQLLTTGGGWQDQVGGIYPGIKKGFVSSDPGQFVDVLPIEISDSFKEDIEKRLCLIYTGKTRLAKNLLQEVVRNWFCGGEVVSTIQKLQNGIEECVNQLEQGIFPSNMTELYYTCKKELATGCEPLFVKQLIEKLKGDQLIETSWLAGAGGGGFLYVYLGQNCTKEQILPHLLPGMTIHEIQISENPFTIDCLTDFCFD